MRFDELVIKGQEDDLRVRFHPELTVLSGLGALERQAFADSLLGSMTGGDEPTALRCTDGAGRALTVVSQGGGITARYDDDSSPAPTPVGSIAPTAAAMRALLLIRATDLGVHDDAPSDDEPAELRDARATLADLTDELDRALKHHEAQAEILAHVHDLDAQIAAARDNEARRAYAEVLARLESVRAEAAAVQSGTAGIETDRNLLEGAQGARELAERWQEAASRLADLRERFGETRRLDPDELASTASMPDQPPADLEEAATRVAAARHERDLLDHRLQELAVASLPAPSDPLVAELGVLEPDRLWSTAERLVRSFDEIERLHVAHGGVAVDETGPGSAVIDEIEEAHAAVEEAARAAESTRIAGLYAAAAGAVIALLGVITLKVLIVVGLVVVAGAAHRMLVLPKRKVAVAARAEREALERAGASSYLAFHIRRVDASVDPHMREQVAVAMLDHRRSTDSWTELVGPDVDVRRAMSLEQEIRAYHSALRELGGAADEIEQLRRELVDRAEPAVVSAVAALGRICEPFGVRGDDLEDVSRVREQVAARVVAGRAARLQGELEHAEADERAAADILAAVLLQIGFGEGDLDARLGALEWAVTQAEAREKARSDARPADQIETERRDLEAMANRLRRPEWATVTAADATALDVEELEAQRAEIAALLTEGSSEVEVERLADRKAAIERRVAALEVRHGTSDISGDPGALADLQQNLLARLATAATAGPHNDPVPLILDEALRRVPADRKWDLLDLLLRLASSHQLVYLSDDAFVAAWARQQAADGNVTMLEPSPA